MKTRELEPEERALLEHLLRVDRPGIDALRAQAEHVLAIAPGDDPFWIDFYVPRDSAAAAGDCRDAVSSASTRGVLDDSTAAEVILFADEEGYLDRIEVTWFDTQPPRPPTPDELEPADRMNWTES